MRKSVLLATVTVLVVLLACGAALAAAGQLDPGFGGDGKVRYGQGQFGFADLIQQPDNKLVAGGIRRRYEFDPNCGCSEFRGYDTLLVRYFGNGSLDTSFGQGGRVVIEGFSLEALALQDDGKIVGSGRVDGGGAALMRFNSDGSPDLSFGDGRVEVAGMDGMGALAIQADGKIVAAGSGSGGIVIARLDSGGSPDPSFGGGDGVVTSDLGGSAQDVRLWQGKLVVVGNIGNGDRGVVARYEADGTPDGSFGGGDGLVESNVPFTAGAVRPKGGVFACGKLYRGPTRDVDFALLRYRRDGSPYTDFGGGDGKVTTNMIVGEASFDFATDLVIQGEGGTRIVVVGYSGFFTPPDDDFDFALVRYNPDGSLNNSFGGGDGRVLTDMGADERAQSIVLEPDGRIVVGGSRTGEGSAFPDEMALARYLGE